MFSGQIPCLIHKFQSLCSATYILFCSPSIQFFVSFYSHSQKAFHFVFVRFPCVCFSHSIAMIYELWMLFWAGYKAGKRYANLNRFHVIKCRRTFIHFLQFFRLFSFSLFSSQNRFVVWHKDTKKATYFCRFGSTTPQHWAASEIRFICFSWA